jgi:hypothetical protein
MGMLKFFRIPFATSGDKVAVPNDSQPSGSVSYTDGFGPDYELDPGVDPAAKDVPRDETNQLYFDITNAIKEYQEFGVPDFITSALNGGSPFSYAKYARVKWTDGKVYESRVNANATDPTNATNWRPLTDNADYLSIATTAFEPSVTDGEAVYWDAPNNRFDEAIANGTSAQNVIGFADVTNGRVFVAGLYAGQLSGLTANVPYYLSPTTPGAITSAGGAVRMGVSRTATSIFVSIGASAAQATETVAGIVELATAAEVAAETDATRALVPSTLKSSSRVAKAWVKFNGTGTPAIIKSFNVSSITDGGTGIYTINFSTALADADYSYTGTAKDVGGGGNSALCVTQKHDSTPTTSALQIYVKQSGTGVLADSAAVCVHIFD